MGTTRNQYTPVDVTVIYVRPNSVLIESENFEGRRSIGRSTIHGSDDSQLDNLDTPCEFSHLRIMTWLVQKEGLS